MSFAVSGNAYDTFMGRYSRELAPRFADFGGIEAGTKVVDVGCGSGVLTEELARRVGDEHVAGIDPSPLLEACRARVPLADLRTGTAESLPWKDGSFDAALAQLVIHFMADPAQGVGEMQRVVRRGGVVAACTWDFAEGMRMLRDFWRAARVVDPDAPAEEMLFGKREQLDALWRERGLGQVEVEPLEVASRYESFDELWGTFQLGVGPAGEYLASLDPDRQSAVRDELYDRLGEPDGAFTLPARAWAVRGRVVG